MKNRAKCKLCESIIESFHSTDYMMCKCGEIAVDGGEAMKCLANNWDNFLRVDDEGHIIIVKVKEDVKENNEVYSRPTRKELVDMLDEMIKNIEQLPQQALTAPITHYDFASALLLLSSILRADS